MKMIDNPITPTVNFDRDGVQHGFLKLPHSHDASAWGSITIPVSVIKNGSGPTAVLTGGNHGDEYEGPIALHALAQELAVHEVSGRIIIVPSMNHPAFRAATRTSPIDGGNLNRLFPGNPAGTVTEKIADYFQRTLLAEADLVLDMHSGGKTLEFVPFCAAHVLDDKQQQARCMAAMEAFNAPYGMMLLEVDNVGMYDTAVEAMGKTFISTELVGGGTARAGSVAIAKRGIRNVLIHAGILPGAPEIRPSIKLDMPDERCFVSSETAGLIEFTVELGDEVSAGQVLAQVYDPERTGRAPEVYEAEIDGVFAGRHFPGLIDMGDVVAVLGVTRE